MNANKVEQAFHWSKGINSLYDYEELASETAMYLGRGTFAGVVYNSLKLAGEAGEIADKIGKIYGKYGTDAVLTPEQILDLKKEAGDVLWHLTALVNDMGITMPEVAALNIDKLKSRQERGVLMDGNGDDR